jgi:hypothetical protein
MSNEKQDIYRWDAAFVSVRGFPSHSTSARRICMADVTLSKAAVALVKSGHHTEPKDCRA